MKFKNLTALLLSMAMIGSLAACGGGDAPSAGGTPDAGAVTLANGDVLDKEQTFTSFIKAEPATLDSGKASDIYSNSVFINCIEPLTRIEQIDGKEVTSAAGAESWETSEDGTVWTFHLRDNKWSDGVAVTAQDYAYGITRTVDPATGSPNAFFITCIKNAAAVGAGEMGVDQLGVKALDDKTLEITLESPTPYFLSLTYTRAMYPVRQDLVEQHGDTYGAELETMAFNGPFMMSSWTHNNMITLVKNDSYWDKDKVYLQTLNYNIISDDNAIYNSFDNGTYDAVSVAEREWMDRFTAMEDAALIPFVNPQTNFCFYNTQDAIFSNVNMRKAFTAALDREELVNAIYQGTVAPSYSWVPEGVSTGDLGDYRAQVPAPLTALLEENADPKALLLKGMEELGLGTDPAALKVTLSFGVTSQWQRNFGEYLQQVFKSKLGVEVVLDYNEWATFQANVNSGNYQMGYQSWTIDYNDPMSMLAIMLAGTNNVPTGWDSPAFDKLINEAAVEPDEAKRVELYKQAENVLVYEDGIVSPVVNITTNRFVRDCVKNMPATFFSDYVGGMKNVYISGRQ